MEKKKKKRKIYVDLKRSEGETILWKGKTDFISRRNKENTRRKLSYNDERPWSGRKFVAEK